MKVIIKLTSRKFDKHKKLAYDTVSHYVQLSYHHVVLLFFPHYAGEGKAVPKESDVIRDRFGSAKSSQAGGLFCFSTQYMNHAFANHQQPIGLHNKSVVARVASPLQVLHSESGQFYVVAGACHMSVAKIYTTLLGIDRTACGAPHHMMTPRGMSARCPKAVQANTLKCAHGGQLPLQQALVAATVLHIIGPEVLHEYVRIRKLQQETLLAADNLLTRGYAIAARGKADDEAQKHLQRMELPVVDVTVKDVNDWMCGKQDSSAEGIIRIMDDVIAEIERRFPELKEETMLTSSPRRASPATSRFS